MSSIPEIWQNLSIWRKAILVLFFIMWIAITGGIVVTVGSNLIITVVSLCLLWLVYTSIAYVVSTASQY